MAFQASEPSDPFVAGCGLRSATGSTYMMVALLIDMQVRDITQIVSETTQSPISMKRLCNLRLVQAIGLTFDFSITSSLI